MSNIVDKVAQCLVEAGSTFREDQKEAYLQAIAHEFSLKGQAMLIDVDF